MEQIRNLRFLYDCLTPFIRIFFIAMASLQLLWDIMLVGTMLYYHRMVEKFISGVIAIFTWYFTYRFWYPSSILPDPPGTGLFYYQHDFSFNPTSKRQHIPNMSQSPGFASGPASYSAGGASGTNHSVNGDNPSGNNFPNTNAQSVPTFMGMPLYINLKNKTSSDIPPTPKTYT